MLRAAGWHAATFVYVVKIGVLAHGRQQVQDGGVDSHFVVTVVLPGVVLDHIEKFSNQKEDSMFWMILVEKNDDR